MITTVHRADIYGVVHVVAVERLSGSGTITRYETQCLSPLWSLDAKNPNDTSRAVTCLGCVARR